MTETISVHLAARSYDVHAGPGLLARAGQLIAPFAPSKRVFVVTDHNVRELHGRTLTGSIEAAGMRHFVFSTDPGEATKTFGGLEPLLSAMLQRGIAKNDLIVAFGGGVVGDLTGLAAGLVKRGIPFVQIPTTLLAQVDSSVGGKTAIDVPEGKNLVGLFHQPRMVIADTKVLETLPERERRAGYAEIVKAGLIADAAFYGWCEAHAEQILACDQQALAHAVAHAIRFKAFVVEADEMEQGERALLNLGHTFAHALEAHGGYSTQLLHGEAVAAGIGLAFQLSANLGLCSDDDCTRVRDHLDAAGFVTDLRHLPGAPFDIERLMTLMAADKKAEAGKLTFILARGIGRAFIERDTPAEVVRELLQQETA